MRSPHRDCAVQTSNSIPELTLFINDAARVNTEDNKANSSAITPTPCEGRQRQESHLNSRGEQCIQMPDKSSAARRHFSKYKQQQLQQMNDEIELGWDCGICLETAEDPCVTRCGHLYCQSHLNHWLSTHPSCPVCKALCTPAQDVVPIFSRGRTSPISTPISSTPPSPAPSDDAHHNHHAASPPPDSRSVSPTPIARRGPWSGVTDIDSFMSDYDIMLEERNPLTPPLPPVPSSSSHIQVHPHPLTTSYLLAHYLGIALRILGVGILLGVLLR